MHRQHLSTYLFLRQKIIGDGVHLWLAWALRVRHSSITTHGPVKCQISGNFLTAIKQNWIQSKLQSCLTLCDSVDCSPSGFSVHVNSPGKNTGMCCHAFFQRIFQRSNPCLLGLLYRQVGCFVFFFYTSATWEAHGNDNDLKYLDHQIVRIKWVNPYKALRFPSGPF